MSYKIGDFEPPLKGRHFYESIHHLRVIEGSDVKIPLPETKEDIYILMYELVQYELFVHNLEYLSIQDEQFRDYYIDYACNYDSKVLIDLSDQLGDESLVDEIYEQCREQFFKNPLIVN